MIRVVFPLMYVANLAEYTLLHNCKHLGIQDTRVQDENTISENISNDPGHACEKVHTFFLLSRLNYLHKNVNCIR